MTLIKSKLDWIDSTVFFALVLSANVLGLFFTTFYPSMDGPAHLYNANVLAQLVSGNETLQQFYSINLIPIPNWLSHFILGLSTLVLPAHLAEKILLVLYMTGMAISFRLMVIQWAPANKSYSLLIFPFIYTFLFYLGFYNYSLSFIFFFLTLWIWDKHYAEGFTLKVKLILMALLALTYLGNVFTYAFLGITLGCLICYEALVLYDTTHDENRSLKKWWKELLVLLQIALPSLIFFVIFYFDAHFFSNDSRLMKDELMKWLFDNRAIIVYDYAKDEMYSKKILWVLVLLVLCIAYRRIRTYEVSNLIVVKKADVILVPLGLALAGLFIVPDGASAGMMSMRFCTLISILAVSWIAIHELPRFAKVFVLVVLFLSAGLFFNHISALKHMDEDAMAIHEAADHVEAGSIVLPVNHSEHWLEGHFSNYLGADKPMIILENYEANVGWFPVRWNMQRMPRMVLAGKEKVEGAQWFSNEASTETRSIDYVLVYGNQNKINEPAWSELREVLNSSFAKVYSNDFVGLYRKKQ